MRIRNLLVAAVLTSAVVATANATVMIAHSIDEMAATADAIVVGVARARTARWDHGHIVTDATIEVATSVTGPFATGSTVTVTTPGGVIGDTGQNVAGSPTLETGSRYVLLLRHAPGGWWEPIGLSQGVLPVRDVSGTAMTFPADTSGLQLRSVGHGPSTIVVPASGMPLSVFVGALSAASRAR
jgi:hypothetical protein